MSIDEVIAVIVGAFAGGAGMWMMWRVRRDKQRDSADVPTDPIARTDSGSVVAAGVDAIHDRLSDEVDRVDAVTVSDTPATDAARLAAERARDVDATD